MQHDAERRHGFHSAMTTVIDHISNLDGECEARTLL